MTSAPRETPTAPFPLTVACGFAALQGGVMVVLAVLELIDFTTARAALVLSTAAFFLLYAAALVGCARALWGLNSWARSPLVLTQLLHLGLAWNLRPGDTVWLAVTIAVVSLVTLVGIFHPLSLRAIAESDAP